MLIFGLIGLGGLTFLFTKLFGKKAVEKRLSKKTSKERLKDTQNMPPTYQPYEYSDFAGQLKTAMSGMGTDEEKIYNVFRKLKNQRDVAETHAAFGLLKGEDLTAWINDELSESERIKIKQILAVNNVNNTWVV